MAHVFISYSRADGHFARLLKLELEKSGFDIWIDTDRLTVGEDWRNEIDNAIQDSYAILVVKSPESFTSQYVTYEWAYAIGIGITTIPILIKPTSFHPRLETIQHLDFTNPNPALQPWNSLIERLRQLHSNISYRINLPKTIPLALKRAVEELDSPNPTNRGSAIGSLTQFEDPIVQEILAQALEHPFPDVREISAYYLVELYNDERAVPQILKMLLGKNPRSRGEAIYVSPKIWECNHEVIDALINCLSDKRYTTTMTGANIVISDIAANSLLRIGTPEAIEAVEKWRNNHTK